MQDVENKTLSYKKFEIEADNENYPDALKDIDGDNPTLYLTGNPHILSEPKVAIIGTRRSTPYGEACARMAACVVAKTNGVLLTGATLGCGAIAAREATRLGARTIVVTATGANRHYPETSKDIFETARKTGAVVSMSTWDTPALPAKFAAKNQLLATLADIVIVCEAATMSGVFSMAEKALRMDKPVFSFPGPIFARASAGANMLIAKGARIITDEQMLTETISKELDVVADSIENRYNLTTNETDDILRAITANPMRPADIANELKYELRDVISKLADYELSGRVVRLPDGRYSLSTPEYLGVRS